MWSNKLNDTGLRAVTGSADFSARVWDALTGLELHQFPHKHIVRTVDFAHRSNRIVTGGERNRALLRIVALRDATAAITERSYACTRKLATSANLLYVRMTDSQC